MLLKNVIKVQSAIRPLCKTFESQCFCTSAAILKATAVEASAPLQQQISPVNPPAVATPLLTTRKLEYLPPFREPKQAWLETLSTIEDQKIGLIDLHPDIFATYPRIDVLHQNIKWQQQYRLIDYRKGLTRAEVKGGGRKPWPQKGTGKARHGSIRSPLWKNGGKAHGPRGPKSYFYMLADSSRTLGLRVALSVKYSQNDLHIVDSLEMPSDEKEYIEELIESRNWGLSVLFIDDTDIMPRNISLALDKIPQYNLMPVYGLNVYSMLKHEKLVLTLRAVEKIEEKLLFQMNKADSKDKSVKKTS